MTAKTGRAEQKERTRRAILDAAMALFAAHGYRGTGLKAIAAEVGVHHTTILYHFGSSEGLLTAVLNERDRAYLERTRDVWEAGPMSALHDLPGIARFNVENAELTKLYVVLEAENLDTDGPAHTYFLGRRRLFHDVLVAMIQHAITGIDQDEHFDVHATADDILAFQTGAHIQWALDPDRVDLVKLYEHYTDNLLRQLRLAPRPGASGADT